MRLWQEHPDGRHALTSVASRTTAQAHAAPANAHALFDCRLVYVVFLFDVDNTLLDNDRIAADLSDHLEGEVGYERGQRYWAISKKLWSELGYAD